MIYFQILTPQETLKKIAVKARSKRLSLNLSQKTLSEKSGVSYGVLKKFEHTGQISLESLLKIACALGSLEDFEHVFEEIKPQEALSLEDLMKEETRKRGRK